MAKEKEISALDLEKQDQQLQMDIQLKAKPAVAAMRIQKNELKLVDGGDNQIGTELRIAREARKMTLEQVSAKLNIKPSQLDFLERGELDRLPEAVYALGFAKEYANFLGMNGNDVVRRLKGERPKADKENEFSFPEPVYENKTPGMTIIGVGAFLSILILVSWIVYSSVGTHNDSNQAAAIPTPSAVAEAAAQAEKQAAEEVKNNPGITINPSQNQDDQNSEATVDNSNPDAEDNGENADNEIQINEEGFSDNPNGVVPQTADIKPSDNAPVQASSESQPSTEGLKSITAPASPVAEDKKTPETKPAEVKTVTADVTKNQNTVQPLSDKAKTKDLKAITEPVAVPEVAVTKPGPNGASAPAVSTDKPANIEIKKKATAVLLKAKEASWIQVTDQDQKVIFRKVLRPGDEYPVPDKKGLTLVTANAGGLEVFVHGQQVAPIGESGEIVRGISLDSKDLENDKVRSRKHSN